MHPHTLRLIVTSLVFKLISVTILQVSLGNPPTAGYFVTAVILCASNPGWSVSVFVGRSVGQCVRRSVGRFVGRSIGWFVGRSVGWLVGRSLEPSFSFLRRVSCRRENRPRNRDVFFVLLHAL